MVSQWSIGNSDKRIHELLIDDFDSIHFDFHPLSDVLIKRSLNLISMKDIDGQFAFLLRVQSHELITTFYPT